MAIKLCTAFRQMTHTEFLALIERILLAIIGHPLLADPIPDPFPTVEKLTNITSQYKTLYHAAENWDRIQIALRDAFRPQVEEEYTSLAHYLTRKAGTETQLLLNVGFTVKDTQRGPKKKTTTVPSQ